MSKIFFAFVLAGFSLSAGAEAPSFTTIQCQDANPKALAPVYMNVDTGDSNEYKGIHFSMGSIVEGKLSETVSGLISVNSADANSMSLSGFIGTSLQINLVNGQGLLSGWVVYDPVTGIAGHGQQLQDYPVTCLLR